jgi:hypothetical protein
MNHAATALQTTLEMLSDPGLPEEVREMGEKIVRFQEVALERYIVLGNVLDRGGM